MMKHHTYAFMPHKFLRSGPPRPTLKQHRRYAMTRPLAFALMVQRALCAYKATSPSARIVPVHCWVKTRLKEQAIARFMYIVSTATVYYLLFLHVD